MAGIKSDIKIPFSFNEYQGNHSDMLQLDKFLKNQAMHDKTSLKNQVCTVYAYCNEIDT